MSVKMDMRWPEALVARIDERAAATGSNRSEVTRRLVERGLVVEEASTPTLEQGMAPAPECGHEADLKRLEAELTEARRQLEPTPPAPGWGNRDAGTCGFGQHGKTTKAGNCERCGQYVGRS